MVVVKANRKRSPRAKNYINNKDLYAEVCKSKEILRENPELKAAAMTDDLVKMLMEMVERYGNRGNWSGYTWNEDSKSDALEVLCKNWQMFNEKEYKNPFAFYTQVMYNSFLGTMGREKKPQKIKDKMLSYMGEATSHGYQTDQDEKDGKFTSWNNDS